MIKSFLLLSLWTVVFAITASGQSIITLAPEADAFVRSGSYATINYGTDPTLLVKGSASSGFSRNSYLKFSLSSLPGTVTSAKLRIYGSNTESTTGIAVSAFNANTDAWTEAGVTYNSRPSHPTTALSIVNVDNIEKYYEWDVTAFVQGQYSGDKVVSFVLKNVSDQNKTVTFNSREASLNRPQLLITTNTPPANQAPALAAIGNKSATTAQPVTFTASATDADAGQTLTFSLINAPGDAAIHATSGVFRWTPSASGNATFTVRVSDNGSPVMSDEEEITVNVSDPQPNQEPVLVTIGNKNAIVGQPLSFTVSATDPDAGQTKTFSLIGAPGGATIDATSGVFNWIPTAIGDFPFTVRVTDNGSPALYDEEPITVTVNNPPPNQAPVLDAIDNQSTTIGQAFTLTATATDPDAGQTKTFSLINNPPSGATIDAATGAFSWTPVATGSFQVTVRVSDNGSPVATDEESFIITVGQPNQPPVLAGIGNKSVTVGETLTFTANATDPDAGQTMNFYLIDAPNNAAIDDNGNFSWSPAASGSFTFTVHVSDDGAPALSDEEQITVTVSDVNQAPVLTDIGDKSTSVGQTLTFTAKTNDPDAGQTKTFSLIGAPSGASINANSGVFTWAPTTSGSFPFKVRVTDNGSPALYDEEQITVTVSSTTVTLAPVADASVRNGTYAAINYGNNDSLLVKGSGTSGFTRTSYLKFSLSSLTGSVTSAKLRLYGKNTENTTGVTVSVYSVATDTWTEPGIVWNNAPAASPSTAIGSAVVNNVAGYYEWNITAFVQAQLAGDKVVSLVLKNASNQNRTISFNSRETGSNMPQLLVATTTAPTNQAPVLAAIGNKTTSVGQTLNFTATATDGDASQTKTFSLIGAPGGATINASSGAFSWAPTSTGSYPFTIRVTDNGSPVLYDEEQITVTVTGAVTTTTFSNTQTKAIPNPGTVSIPITVSGLPSRIDTISYGLQSVSVQITHPTDKELTLQLKSPDNKVIYLFRKSPGVNINTTFDAVSSGFIDNNEIATYTGSFSSGYRPRQDLALLNNGQNPNGIWNLVVKDDNSASATGQVTNVSLVFGSSPAMPLLSSSTLPIIKIYTQNGVDIVDDPKILADMYIINNGAGAINYANQTTYEYAGKIGIEIRGNSSASLATLPKRQYGFETKTADGAGSVDVSLLGMPAKDDWILSAVMSDKSLMRNVLTYQLARDMGYWASRTKFVEVMINDEYRGVFIFSEKIKRDKNRVNVEKLETTDVTEPRLTGGYIFSVDDLDAGDISWKTKYAPEPDNPYKFVVPKPEDLVTAQRTYLQNYVGEFEDALHGSNFQDPINGFRKYADDKSFMDFFILNEFAKNNDGFRFSAYFHKKRGGKIIAGPVWDFDRGYRNDGTCHSALPEGYTYLQHDVCSNRTVPWWWARLLQDPKYKADLVCRYNTLRQNILKLSRINYLIDSAAAVLNAGAQQRNFIRWNTWGKYVVWIPKPYATSYAMEIDAMKDWISQRTAWLDDDLGTCTVNMITRNTSTDVTETDEKAVSAVYPSPFKDRLSVAVNSDKEQQATFQLVDVNGKVVYQKAYALQKGSQLIQLNLKDKQLASGLYLLHIKGSDMSIVKKVLKK